MKIKVRICLACEKIKVGKSPWFKILPPKTGRGYLKVKNDKDHEYVRSPCSNCLGIGGEQ